MKYRHYKGGLYELVCEATLESDLSPMIVYRAQDGSIWTRPKAVFFELVDIDGRRVPRFERVDERP
ncbi:MAG: DUF1653 domain-containing protein [Pseudomonadota bacterium]